jgi:hypothetical protein
VAVRIVAAPVAVALAAALAGGGASVRPPLSSGEPWVFSEATGPWCKRREGPRAKEVSGGVAVAMTMWEMFLDASGVGSRERMTDDSSLMRISVRAWRARAWSSSERRSRRIGELGGRATPVDGRRRTGLGQEPPGAAAVRPGDVARTMAA